MGVYLIVMSQDLPRTGDNAPLVGILYVTLFYVMVLGTTTGVITAGMSFKITTPPQWLRRLVLKLTKRNSNKVGAIKNSFRNGDAQKETAMDEQAKSTMDITEPNERDDNVSPKEHGNALPRSILRRTTSLMMGNGANKSLHEFTQKEVDNQEQWQEISSFFDRMFFWIYFVAIILASCSALLGL